MKMSLGPFYFTNIGAPFGRCDINPNEVSE